MQDEVPGTSSSSCVRFGPRPGGKIPWHGCAGRALMIHGQRPVQDFLLYRGLIMWCMFDCLRGADQVVQVFDFFKHLSVASKKRIGWRRRPLESGRLLPRIRVF